MKIKRILFTAILIIVVFTGNVSFAKDIALDIIEGDHDYLILATISDISDEYITAEFYNTLNKTEDTPSSSIKIEKFRYSYCIDHADSFNTPKVGDNFFAAMDKKGDIYIAGPAYKTDTVDERTLSIFVPSAMENQDCITDPIATAYYIRMGGSHHEFAFAENSVSVMNEGEEIVIYPSDNKTPFAIKYVSGEGKKNTDEKQQDVLVVNPNTNTVVPDSDSFYAEMLHNKRIFAFIVLISGIFAGMLMSYLAGIKRKKN